MRGIIWKQWKTIQKREWGLLKLGALKWIAHNIANYGDHYQLVATKSVLARTVSKEKTDQARLSQSFGLLPKGSTYSVLN